MASIALTPLSMNTTHNHVHHRHSPHSATITTPVIETTPAQTTPAFGSGDRADTGDDDQPGRRSDSVDGEDIDRFIAGKHVIQ